MTFNVLSSQIVMVADEFHYAFGQLILFILGILISVIVGIWLLPYVFTYEDLFWYFIGMLIPLLPFMLGFERCKL